MDMDLYRQYMDRLKLSAADHQRILDGLVQTRPKGRRILRKLAACLAVVAVAAGVFVLWRSATPGTALVPSQPSPGQSQPASSPPFQTEPAPTPATEHSRFLVPSLPDGYYFTDEYLDLPDLTGEDCLYICSGYPTADTQISTMTAENLCSVCGGEELADLSPLGWSGFTVSGTFASIPDQGIIWAKISGADGESSFQLSLSPDALPPMEENYDGATSFDRNGVSVTGYRLYEDRNSDGTAEHTYRVSFLCNGPGYYLEVISPDETACQLLTKAFLAQVTSGSRTFSLDSLVPAPAHTITVEDPFDGQPHSSFMLPALSFPQWDDSPTLPPPSASLYLPENTYSLTADGIRFALGNPEEVPWMLNWVGFGVDGRASYDENGQLLSASITGVKNDASFTLLLTPNAVLPEEGGWSEAQYGGVTVATWSWDGTYFAAFPCGEGYAYFSCTGPDAGVCMDLCTRAVSVGSGNDGGFTLFYLSQEISSVQSLQLS